MEFPSSESEYSTLGGTSGYTVRITIPSLSMERRLSVNTFLLSVDLATLFTGRYIGIHVFPFSFREYCQYYNEIDDKEKLFDEYTIKGGLAGSYAYKTEADRIRYIKEVYETIVTRDLVGNISNLYTNWDLLIYSVYHSAFSTTNFTLPFVFSPVTVTVYVPLSSISTSKSTEKKMSSLSVIGSSSFF